MTTVKQVCPVCEGRCHIPVRRGESEIVWNPCVYCQGIGTLDVEDPPSYKEEKPHE
jgi:DnaJ-class molecular chaperone